jgi:hypothetical protein
MKGTPIGLHWWTIFFPMTASYAGGSRFPFASIGEESIKNQPHADFEMNNR